LCLGWEFIVCGVHGSAVLLNGNGQSALTLGS
jgi:hypothetical protein